MYVEHKKTGEKFEARIEKLHPKEFKGLKNSTRFDFDWSVYKDQEVYKLCVVGSGEILGLIRVIDQKEPGFDFLEVDVLEISKENQGRDKGLGRIGGCLLAYAALLSDHYGHDGFISLVAKNKKADLFHQKFGFQFIGSMGVLGERMVSETSNSINLIKEYINP